MSSDYAARTLKQVIELRAAGATWQDVADVLHIAPVHPGRRGETGKIAKKLAKEAARVSQRTLAERGIGFS